MPPASQTDVGWVPPEVKKRLKEEARARKAAEAEAGGKADGKEDA
jgi:NADH-quinone oxidoreductase subunit B